MFADDNEQEGEGLKSWVSVVCAVVGVCLIGASFFVSRGESAHVLLHYATQGIMIIAGAVAIIAGITTFFLRDAPNIWR